MAWDLIVDRRDPARARLLEGPLMALGQGQARLAIERLALSANNLTYAVSGETLGFWSLFDAPPGAGRIPAWGHALVEASRHPDVREGERFFGLLPMSSHWTFSGRRSRIGLRDESPSRTAVNPVYNQYATVAAPAGSDREADRELDLAFRPVFITAFVLDQYLRSHDFFGARTVWLISASSRTALGLAFLLAPDTAVTGLTSPGNRNFVRQTGLHRDVVDYAQISTGTGAGTEAADGQVVLVDFAGDAVLTGRIAGRLGPRLQRVIRVGSTHWEAAAMSEDDPPTPAGVSPFSEFFFGPAHIQTLIGKWGPAQFEQRLGLALGHFIDRSRAWYTIEHADGPQGLLAAYDRLVAGLMRPQTLCVARPGGPLPGG